MPTVLNPDFSVRSDGSAHDWETLYAGYHWDAESGLYYVRYREMHSLLGLWVTRDPLGFHGGDWSLYRYVNNRPTVSTDALGLTCGECLPPSAGNKNAYFVSYQILTSPGFSEPSKVAASEEALQAALGLEKFVTLVNLIKGFRSEEAALEAIRDWLGDQAYEQLASSEAVVDALHELADQITENVGFGVFVRLSYYSCDPCWCIMSTLLWGSTRYQFVKHTLDDVRCGKGRGIAGIFGGQTGAALTQDIIKKCIKEAEKGIP